MGPMPRGLVVPVALFLCCLRLRGIAPSVPIRCGYRQPIPRLTGRAGKRCIALRGRSRSMSEASLLVLDLAAQTQQAYRDVHLALTDL